MKTLKSALRENCEGCNSNGYYDSYKQNVYKNTMEQRFQDMFDAGDGNELHSKAEAVHSSSMLAYNFFHWINKENTFIWDGVTYSEVYFEVKMKTIKGSKRCANMDVVLIGKKEDKNHILFIESKFLEYEYAKSKKEELSPKYYESANWYYTINKKNEEIKWEKILGKWNEMLKHDSGSYLEGIKQNITHLFGIHGLKNGGGFTGKMGESLNKLIGDINYNNMKFINLIFHPASKYNEYNSYNAYNELFKKFKTNLDGKGLKVIPEWISYSDLWNIMDEQILAYESQDKNIKGLRDYLFRRYIAHAEPNEEKSNI